VRVWRVRGTNRFLPAAKNRKRGTDLPVSGKYVQNSGRKNERRNESVPSDGEKSKKRNRFTSFRIFCATGAPHAGCEERIGSFQRRESGKEEPILPHPQELYPRAAVMQGANACEQAVARANRRSGQMSLYCYIIKGTQIAARSYEQAPWTNTFHLLYLAPAPGELKQPRASFVDKDLSTTILVCTSECARWQSTLRTRTGCTINVNISGGTISNTPHAYRLCSACEQSARRRRYGSHKRLKGCGRLQSKFGDFIAKFEVVCGCY